MNRSEFPIPPSEPVGEVSTASPSGSYTHGDLLGSRARLAGIIDSAMDAIVTVDAEHRIVVFNRAAEAMFKCSSADAIGQRLDRFIPQRFRSGHSQHIDSFGKTGVSTRAMAGSRAVFGLRSTGEEFPIEASISQVETGGKKFYTAIMRDVSERERAEERFRQLIEAAPNGMVMVDESGFILLVNAQIEKSFGYKREELLGQPIERLVPERFRPHHPGYVQGFIADPSTRAMGTGRDLFGLRKDGTEFPVEIGLNPLKTETGMAVLGTIVDITERKAVEETLRRSEQQLAGVIESAMDAIISVDSDQKIVLFNAAAERMFMYPADAAIGEALERFIPARFREIHRQHVENFSRTNVTRRSMESLSGLFGLRADGTEFPIEASISQLTADGRKIFTVILRDISERRQAEAELRERTKILDLAPVLISDLNNRIILWNTGAENMYGWTAEEAVGQIAHELLKTEFTVPFETLRNHIFAHGRWEGDLVHTKRDGRKMIVASTWVLHSDENGVPKAFLRINNDITERKHAEEEVRRLNAHLEQRVEDRTAQLTAVNKELEAFSYSISHDLRAPLRHINGFSQALLEDYREQLDEVGRSLLDEICEASREMSQMIDDVLKLARVTRSEMKFESVDLSEIAEDVISDLRRHDPERNVRVQIEQDLSASGDKRLLRFVVSNLLGNAWKFTSGREAAEIEFGSEHRDGEPVFFVADNGAGFDMRYADKLFGAFQRLHSADKFEGTGVGLATVKRIIERHGGRVWVDAKLDAGATFYFTLSSHRED